MYSKIQITFEEHIKNKKLTGGVCGIYQKDKELYKGAWGYRDCLQQKTIKDNAIFRLASMTKPITAVAILIAEERGWLKLEDPISKYILGFHHNGVGLLSNGQLQFLECAREITIHDCLTHSSGLGSGEIGNYQFLRFDTPKELKENVESWNGSFLDFAPKTKQCYSGVVAFEILAYIVQIVSGMPFAEFLQKEIFSPLGMKDTMYCLSKTNEHRLIEMSTTATDGGLLYVDYGKRGFAAFAKGYTGGSAGLFSTLEDYSKFVRMLACNGAFEGVRILSAKSVEKMRTAQLPYTLNGINQYFNWGLGVRVCEKQGEWQPLPAGSFGWSGAYGTHFWIEPDTGRSAILMLNKADVNGSGSPFSREFEYLCSINS